MENLILRVIEAFKRRSLKSLKRRSPAERMKSRRYYRSHRNKILLNRRRYKNRTSPFKKTNKLFKRPTPSWMHKRKPFQSVKPITHKRPPSYKPKMLKHILKRPLKRLVKLFKGAPQKK